jgi:hypothetical protein
MKHGYEGHYFKGDIDIEPLDYCPKCGAREWECRMFTISRRRELIEL